ncbi:hypothetical protein EZV62_024829 [Acer yangbiense]|uniref:DUF4283 domain-containing protein n=1 Tax=Acer yangbiense TaxID=1000413 RepID=A0A5C7GVX0_9ROSI|nr:hypothetical protein EZV62_024829 [Acer yangbiense]
MDTEEIARLCATMTLKEREGLVRTLRKELRAKGSQRLSSSLVGNVLSKQLVNREAFMAVMAKIWRVKGRLEIEMVSHNIFTFHFSDPCDKQMVLAGGPWSFDNDLIVLEEPKGRGEIQVENRECAWESFYVSEWPLRPIGEKGDVVRKQCNGAAGDGSKNSITTEEATQTSTPPSKHNGEMFIFKGTQTLTPPQVVGNGSDGKWRASLPNDSATKDYGSVLVPVDSGQNTSKMKSAMDLSTDASKGQEMKPAGMIAGAATARVEMSSAVSGNQDSRTKVSVGSWKRSFGKREVDGGGVSDDKRQRIGLVSDDDCLPISNKRELNKDLKAKQRELQCATAVIRDDSWDDIRRIEKELDDLLEVDEMYWRQRSRENWLQCGDKNSKFFHASASARRSRNKISGIFDSSNS